MAHRDYKVVDANITGTSQAPKGKDIYYRCKQCKQLVPSQPKDNVRCVCGNICIDIDYLRLLVKDYAMFEAVRVMKPHH